MTRIYIFKFNRVEVNKVEKIILIHTSSTRANDLVQKYFPKDSTDKADWSEGYDLTIIGETLPTFTQPRILAIQYKQDDKQRI